MSYSSNAVLQPFNMEINPVKKLVLFNFDNYPDTIYSSLELQWLDSSKTGKGFRLIAYRIDGYVDVYDDTTLIEQKNLNFNVCGKGLNHYIYAPFMTSSFDVINSNLEIHFSLYDYSKRKIEVYLKEQSKRPTKPFSLIAPVGVSSQHPTFLPVFAMYSFDLIRKKNTQVSITIDGRSFTPDNFPVPLPKEGQMRSFIRYSPDCELIDFGLAHDKPLKLLECNHSKSIDNNLLATYHQVKEQYLMDTLSFCHAKHHFKVSFENGFPDLLRMKDGTITHHFKMQMDNSMGYFAGYYTVTKQGIHIAISLVPNEGWTLVPPTFFAKILLQKKSMFRTWPKSYRYTQHINLDTLETSTSWERIGKDTQHIVTAQSLF